MQESNLAVTSSSATTPTSKSSVSDKANSNEDGTTGRNGINASPSSNASTTTPTNPSDIDQAKFEADKRSIYKWVERFCHLGVLGVQKWRLRKAIIRFLTPTCKFTFKCRFYTKMG